MNLGYASGVICGLLAVALVSTLLALLRRKGCTSKNAQYDERQEQARGKSYRYAFFTLVIYLLVWGLFELATGIRWCDTCTGCFLGIFVSVDVFAITAVCSDAYFAVNERPGWFLGIFSVVTVLNLAIGARQLLHGEAIIENGLLTYRSCNLLVGVCFLVLTVTAAVHLRRAGREDA